MIAGFFAVLAFISAHIREGDLEESEVIVVAAEVEYGIAFFGDSEHTSAASGGDAEFRHLAFLAVRYDRQRPSPRICRTRDGNFNHAVDDAVADVAGGEFRFEDAEDAVVSGEAAAGQGSVDHRQIGVHQNGHRRSGRELAVFDVPDLHVECARRAPDALRHPGRLELVDQIPDVVFEQGVRSERLASVNMRIKRHITTPDRKSWPCCRPLTCRFFSPPGRVPRRRPCRR